MAKMIKIESLPTHGDDLKATHSVSDFISDMPSQLCWSDGKSICHLKLFWSQDHNLEFIKNNGLEAIIEKIKSALHGLDIFLFPTLFQLWAPKTIGSQQFLVSSDLPFGINCLRKGLCLYRKLCLDYKYSLDGEEELGPVGRVFRYGFPEFSPNLAFYSTQEFKLRDRAKSCGVYGYLVLPVFEAAGKKCACVLELLTVWDGNHCLTNAIEKVSQALKAVELRISNFHWLIDMEKGTRHEFALSEIEKDLKVVCHAHSIPLAQTWFSSTRENYTEIVMCTSEKGSNMLLKKVSSFQEDCIKFGLKKGQGVVWRAFTSGTSFFCKDVSQLSINEYSLVLSARKVGLSASFAICLKSSFTGDNVYVLEFFLPFKHCLNSLRTAVEHHFKRFKVASRQDQGTDRTFGISNCVTGDGRNTNIKNDHPVAAPNKSVVTTSGTMLCANPSRSEPENTGFTFDVSIPTEKQLHRERGLESPSNKRKADHSLSEQHNEGAKNHNTKSCQGGKAGSALHPEEGTIDNGGSMMIKVSYKENIIKFHLPLSSGIIDLESEINKRLKLTAGSFEIKYRNEHDDCILLASDADLQNLMCDMVSKSKKTIKLLLQPVQNQLSERCINSACPVPLTMLSDSIMIIKATYKEDILKFQFSFHSGLLELKDEVMKRLKLKGDSFIIKYLGENSEWIRVDSDTDLKNCMTIVRSLKSQTLRLLLEPVASQFPEERATAVSPSAAQATARQNGSTMTIKATYKEDIIKFHFSPSSGMMELKNEVTKRLKLSSESFRVKYQDDANWIYLSGDEDLQNHLSSMALSNRFTVKFHLEPVKN